MRNNLIRGVNKNLWNKLKAVSALNDRTIGEELTLIITNHVKKELADRNTNEEKDNEVDNDGRQHLG